MNAEDIARHLREAAGRRPTAPTAPAPKATDASYALLVAFNDDEYGDALEGAWFRHRCLGTEGTAECYADMLEAVLAEWPSADDQAKAVSEAFEQGQDEAEERLKAEHEGALSELQDKLDEARKLLGDVESHEHHYATNDVEEGCTHCGAKRVAGGRSVHEQTKALSEERRVVQRELLQKLQAVMVLPAKDLRRNVQRVIVDLLRQVNE